MWRSNFLTHLFLFMVVIIPLFVVEALLVPRVRELLAGSAGASSASGDETTRLETLQLSIKAVESALKQQAEETRASVQVRSIPSIPYCSQHWKKIHHSESSTSFLVAINSSNAKLCLDDSECYVQQLQKRVASGAVSISTADMDKIVDLARQQASSHQIAYRNSSHRHYGFLCGSSLHRSMWRLSRNCGRRWRSRRPS